MNNSDSSLFKRDFVQLKESYELNTKSIRNLEYYMIARFFSEDNRQSNQLAQKLLKLDPRNLNGNKFLGYSSLFNEKAFLSSKVLINGIGNFSGCTGFGNHGLNFFKAWTPSIPVDVTY